MSYIICQKNKENEDYTLVTICENETDKNQLNLDLDEHKTIAIDTTLFNELRLGVKRFKTYASDNSLTFDEHPETEFTELSDLSSCINSVVKQIDCFLISNNTHPQYDKWNNYKNQLNSLDLSTITFPLTKSLEQHLEDSSLTSLNPLQIP
tara:strand:- start:4431 stop:4883 length:453 start_codon:yes stop_codon:yes gene_type:complete